MIIDINKIKIDGGTQTRKMKQDVVAQFADDMERGDVFPPIVVFSEGATYWLSDGFHRYFANKRLKKLTIEADVFEGTARDAEWNGMGANNKHGFRVTNADKRAMGVRILTDIEWQEMSDRQIADHLGVSHVFINKLRNELKEQSKQKTAKKKEQKKADPTPQAKPDYVAEFTESEVEREQMAASIEMLRKENEELQDQLTVVQSASIDDIQKEKAESVIKDLRAQIRALEIELKEVTISRDMYQRENGELKKQVSSLLKKLKKLEG